jgi:hypothetical protein
MFIFPRPIAAPLVALAVSALIVILDVSFTVDTPDRSSNQDATQVCRASESLRRCTASAPNAASKAKGERKGLPRVTSKLA